MNISFTCLSNYSPSLFATMFEIILSKHHSKLVIVGYCRKPDSLPGQVSFHHVQNPNPSTPTPQARHLRMGPSMTGDIFRRDSQSLVVGHEYDDVQTFRNALTSAAIASNFELHMIRSDQRRVTAR